MLWLAALDPVCGKPIFKSDLIRVPAAEVPKLIAAYNNTGDKEDQSQKQDGAATPKLSNNAGE